jgi:hypothetical protein
MDGTERLGGRQQLRTGPLGLARGQPVLGDPLRRRPRALETLGDLPMVYPPPRPRDLRVHGLADERVTKRCDALVHLDEEAQLDRLLETRCTGEVGDEREINPLACDRSHFERVPAGLREPVGAHEHGLADAIRQRHLVTRRQLDRTRVLLETPACGERARELLDEERHALSALEDPLHEPRPGPPLEDPRGQLSDLIALERLHHQLLQPPAAAKLCAHATERMSPRDVVASVRREEEERPVLHARRQRWQKVEGRFVAPVKIVEEYDRGLPTGDPRERVAERLGEEELVDDPGRRGTELRKKHREMARETPGPGECPWGDPVVRPQGRDDWGVRRPCLVADDTPQDEKRAIDQSGLRQAGLPDACFPRYEEEATLSSSRTVEPVAEYSKLSLTSDELDVSRHRESVRCLRHAREAAAIAHCLPAHREPTSAPSSALASPLSRLRR